jgi:hypothetical protein
MRYIHLYNSLFFNAFWHLHLTSKLALFLTEK